MNDRERFLAVMDYRKPDRCVYGVMTGGWPETYERWRTEGWDPAQPPRFTGDRWDWQGGWFHPNPPFEREVVEEDERTVLYINHEGILMRERMQPDLAGRIGADYAQRLAAYRDRGYPLIVIADRWGGMFGGLRAMVGVERLCTLFYDDPAFVEEMMDGVADFLIAMMDRFLDHTDVDVFGFWEDMGFKTASLLSPAMFRKYMVPRYAQVTEWLRSRGVKHVGVDSDGDVSELIPLWLEAGLDLVWPMEVAAGMDVVALRREYGQDLNMIGGIDKRVLAVGGQTMRDEVDRIMPVVESGGYIPEIDHSAPPDISWPNMCEYMEYLMMRLGRG